MHSWWKSSSKDANKKTKKTSKETIFDVLQRKLKIPSENKIRSVVSRRRTSDITSDKGSLSRVPSRSPSPSTQVSRCQSFADRPYAQPLPLPGSGVAGRTASGISISKPGLGRSTKPCLPSLQVPLPAPDRTLSRAGITDVDGDLATASVSSDFSIDSDDPADSRLPSPKGHDFENGIKTAANSPTR